MEDRPRPAFALLELAGLCNPFEEGSVSAIMNPVVAWLDQIDDLDM